MKENELYWVDSGHVKGYIMGARTKEMKKNEGKNEGMRRKEKTKC